MFKYILKTFQDLDCVVAKLLAMTQGSSLRAERSNPGIPGKSTVMGLVAIAVIVGMGTFSLKASEHPTVSMVPPNVKPCAGHCEAQNINCDKSTKEHGSYHWCKENCLSPTKADLQKFQEGIGSCHAAPLSSLESDLTPTSAKP